MWLSMDLDTTTDASTRNKRIYELIKLFWKVSLSIPSTIFLSLSFSLSPVECQLGRLQRTRGAKTTQHRVIAAVVHWLRDEIGPVSDAPDVFFSFFIYLMFFQLSFLFYLDAMFLFVFITTNPMCISD